MGTGDYICVTMSGGAPWGFRLQGGKEYHEILHVSKVRSKSKASVAGLCVGDEVMSINGNPCTDIPYSEVVGIIEKSMDSLQMFVKRSPSKPQSAESKNGQQENINRELGTESTMLQIRLGPETEPIEQNISEMQDQLLLSKTGYDTALLEVKKDNEVMLEHKITPRVIETSKDGVTGDITLTRRIEEGAMVELQLSLPQDIHLGSVGSPTLTLLGVDQCTSPETEHIVLQDEVACEHLDEKEPPRQQTSATFQIVGKQQAKIISAGQTGEVCFPRVELILDCSGREKEPRSQSDRGSVISGEEGGQTEAPPSTVSFGIKAEDLEEGEEAQQAERELIRPNKHRARHAKLRRSESLSEKQVKEAKSKCKSIALLLTAAPNPNSKGVLMFKKRRQRARKFTLTSYGTGELERQADDEDDNEDEEDKENTFNVTFYGASESDLDDDFFSDPENNTQIVTFNWDTGLVEVEKKLNSGDAMEELPETKGKGVLMFARRKQRMDQITAEQEELRKHSMEEKVSLTENVNNTVSFQIQQKQSIKMQSCVSKSYIEVSNTQARVQNGFPAAHESIPSFQSSSNKTPKPFGGSQNRAAIPFSPTRNIASPMSDVPGPPPYSSVTPPPEPRFQVSSPVSAKAQAAVWAPSFSTEQIASRDERISVPANKTGILQEAKRRSTKPMFTFKEQPKISPRPELLTLVQTREGKRSAGNESGPEEDYLSLGAEACNFMQAHAGKQKTPPPVAPKPSVRSPTAVPTSPVWAPPTAAPAPQVISVQISPHIASPVEDNVAQPKYNSYNPPTSAPVWAPPTAAPAPQVFSSQFPPQSSAPVEANVAQPKYNSYNPQPAAPVWAPSTAAPAPQVFSSQFPPQSAAPIEANVAQPKYNSYNPPTSLNLSGPLRGPPATAPAVNQLYTPKTPPTTPSGASAVGTAYEMPALRGKGAELFARRQSRMEKFIVDSTTVQEKAARPLSPTPSLPSSWKYSSNVRAPPPLAYNPIQSPLYPPAANKSVSKTASAAKKKPTKTLSALQVMKHQPYQLNSSLFTFQAPSDAASDTEAPKKNTKSDFVSSTKQATFNRPVNTAPSSNFIPAPENPQPAYNMQASQASAFNQSRETYPIGYPMQPRQESPITPLIAPPRPKFSAKKAGATAQERDDGRAMSFPARSFSSASSQPFGSPISPMLFQPAPGYAGKSATTPETPGKRLTPWEAAAKSPLGFVDDAFMSQTVHESVSAKIVSAARRKTLPEPPAAWKNTSNVPTTGPYAHKGLYENKRNSISTVPKNVVSAPSFQCGYQLRHPYSSTHSITNARSLPLETRSEYGMSTGHNPNFNPYPRAWRS